MKDLRTYLMESAKDGQDGKDNVLTPVYNKNEDMYGVIVGPTFTNDRDEHYVRAKQIVKKFGYTIRKDLKQAIKEMGEAADEVEAFGFVSITSKEVIAEVQPIGEDGFEILYK